MIFSNVPTKYSSAFQPACYGLAEIGAPEGADFDIMSVASTTPLGTKRIYSATTGQINVSPYLRQLIAPTPMCDKSAGIHQSVGRTASGTVRTPEGVYAPITTLCAGTEAISKNTLLSAAPHTVTIAPGERDEMSVVSEARVIPVVTFKRGANSYTDNTSLGQCTAVGMSVTVIDVNHVCNLYAARTGAPASELEEFTVRLKLDQSGFQDQIVERHYVIDRSGGNTRQGRRLAWINRFGAIDYHTFPTVTGYRSSGSHTSVSTPGGLRTVATTATQSIGLSSEPCSPLETEWLAEIFSSPAVWTVRGSIREQVEVEAGEVVCDPSKPAVVSLTISPAAPPTSRKF
jgi:hypothetical protein